MNEHAVAHVTTWKTDLWLSARGRGADSPAMRRWLDGFLRGEIARLDLAASRFRPDSELTFVNEGAGRWVPVSWYFVTVLTAALDAARATGGLVDPTFGYELTEQGYEHWSGQPTPARRQVRPPGASWRDVEIRPGGDQALVRIPPGVGLDLGAVAKGWLADRLATTTHRTLGLDVLANAGGDLRCVADHQPWTVWAEPGEPDRAPRAVDLLNAGLATSGIGRRRWQGEDGPHHHIIDPRTGTSARTCWTSVTVVAASAAAANTAATASLIRGEDATGWLTSLGLDAWLVGPGGHCAMVGAWAVSEEVAA